MKTEFTFVNEVAARLFMVEWNRLHTMHVTHSDSLVAINPKAAHSTIAEFRGAAKWFNLAAQHASEIVKWETL